MTPISTYKNKWPRRFRSHFSLDLARLLRGRHAEMVAAYVADADSVGIMRPGGLVKNVRKADLPTKLCPVGQRPFAWRKKWSRVWDEVRYCSERCRRNRSPRG